MLEQRDAMSQVERAAADSKIQKLLFSCTLYQKSEHVFCYVSFQSEADTHEIIRKALKDGKKVAVPKVIEKRQMNFYYIEREEELTRGCFGILEPPETAEKLAIPKDHTIIIMPGTAFDENGNRIGYGGGYYDTYLQKYPECPMVALAYEIQCLHSLPHETHDVRPDIIITEKRMIKC